LEITLVEECKRMVNKVAFKDENGRAEVVGRGRCHLLCEGSV